MWWTMRSFLKFTCSEKATKFCKISTYNLSNVLPVKWLVEISQNVAALSEYMNFNYQEYNQPHQHLCIVHESWCIHLEEVSQVRLPKFPLDQEVSREESQIATLYSVTKYRTCAMAWYFLPHFRISFLCFQGVQKVYFSPLCPWRCENITLKSKILKEN